MPKATPSKRRWKLSKLFSDGGATREETAQLLMEVPFTIGRAAARQKLAEVMSRRDAARRQLEQHREEALNLDAAAARLGVPQLATVPNEEKGAWVEQFCSVLAALPSEKAPLTEAERREMEALSESRSYVMAVRIDHAQAVDSLAEDDVAQTGEDEDRDEPDEKMDD